MRAWLITVGEPLPTDPGAERLLRTGLLARTLVERGHQVTWWTSSFHHDTKQQRCDADQRVPVGGIDLRLIYAPGYPRNVSLARIRTHRATARRFAALAAATPAAARPDVVVCSLPTVELAAAATVLGRQWRVPVVVDIRDLWPDVIEDMAPRPFRSLAAAALWPMRVTARTACRQAHALTGITDEFVDWGLAQAGRRRSNWDRTFAMGYSGVEPSRQAIDDASAWWATLGIERDSAIFTMCYFGAIGHQSEFETVFEAVRRLRARHRVRAIFCGAGDRLDRFRSQTADVPEIRFPGRVKAAAIWTLMRLSDAGLAPYRDTPNYRQNVPNKPVEYMSAGLPVITTGPGTLASLLEREQCGVSYPHRQADRLAVAIELLISDAGARQEMGRRAVALFERDYRAESVYPAMAEHLEQIAGAVFVPAGMRA